MAKQKYKCHRCKEYVVQHRDNTRPVRSGAMRDYSDAREGCTNWECDDEFCPYPRTEEREPPGAKPLDKDARFKRQMTGLPAMDAAARTE